MFNNVMLWVSLVVFRVAWFAVILATYYLDILKFQQMIQCVLAAAWLSRHRRHHRRHHP